METQDQGFDAVGTLIAQVTEQLEQAGRVEFKLPVVMARRFAAQRKIARMLAKELDASVKEVGHWDGLTVFRVERKGATDDGRCGP